MIHKKVYFFATVFLLMASAAAMSGCGQADIPPPTPTLSPEIILGKQVFSAECARCHATVPGTVIVGPSLAGIADRAADREPGVLAKNYLLKSIMVPDSYVVEGFEDLMPADLAKKLTGEELDAVVAYLLTLELAAADAE